MRVHTGCSERLRSNRSTFEDGWLCWIVLVKIREKFIINVGAKWHFASCSLGVTILFSLLLYPLLTSIFFFFLLLRIINEKFCKFDI